MVLTDELQGLSIQAQAAAAKQGDTVRSLKASLKEGKADKVSNLASSLHVSLLPMVDETLTINSNLCRPM